MKLEDDLSFLHSHAATPSSLSQKGVGKVLCTW